MGIGPAAGQDRATCLALAGPLWHPRSRSGRSALTASTVSRPSMLGRTPGARRRAARSAASEEQESEKRSEEKGGASPPPPSFRLFVDGAPGRALASLGLRGSYRSRGLRPHPAMDTPPRVVSINTSCASGHSQQRTGGSEVTSTAAFSLFVARAGRGGCEAFGSCNSMEVPLWYGSPPSPCCLAR